MVFSSPIFLFLFLPLFLLAYGALFAIGQASRDSRRRGFCMSASNLLLLLSSLFFYFWGEQWIVLVMLASITIDYFCGLYIGSASRPGKKKAAVVLSIVANLALLGFFKYLNFGLDAANQLIDLLGGDNQVLRTGINITLPLGISFYTFQSMSYTIDVYRGVIKPNRRFIDFACFVAMFPQLVAGPIVRYRDIDEQLRNRSVSRDDFSEGCVRFVIGLGKKVLIADTVAIAVDGIFSVPDNELTMGLAWLGLFCFVIQVYYDFSGYSDMAIGLGRMIGFRFRENFNYPYLSASITEFWQRWHISLSTWFRDYVYKSMRGDRRDAMHRYRSLFLVFLLVGLWHGASWTFVVFGLYHALFITLERAWLSKWLAGKSLYLRYCYAIPVIYMSFLVFRSNDLGQVLVFLKAMFGAGTGDGLAYNLPMYLRADVVCALIVGTVFSLPVARLLARAGRYAESAQANILARMSVLAVEVSALGGILLLSIVTVSANTYNPFIYFRF